MREGFVKAVPAEQAPEPTATTAPIAPKSDWPVTVKLQRKPIKGNRGEELTQLTFREPTGADIIRHGNPVRIDSDGEIQMDEKKMTAMMAQLSDVLPPLIGAMHPVDWNSCAYRLRAFFLPDPSSW
jgi:hypothetical protein